LSELLVVARVDLCLGFALAGVVCVACHGRDEALEAIGRATISGRAGIVIVEEELLEGADPRLRRDLIKRARPLIVVLPGALMWKDAEDVSRDDLVARLVRQAVGYRINIKI
jgi:vacuolar-type H+-ATPase subunit F/Vma7